MAKKKDKVDITVYDIVILEKACLLVVLSSFEHDLTQNIKTRFREYGFSTQITKLQQDVLKELAQRYDDARNVKFTV